MRDRTPDDPKVIANVRHRNINKWPEKLPNFRAVIREYQDTMQALALSMLPVYARALEMPADYFDAKFTCPEFYNRCSCIRRRESRKANCRLAPIPTIVR